MTEFYDWDEVRAELGGDEATYEQERARTEAWVSAFHLAEERKRLGLTQRQVAELMGVTPGRVSQIENGESVNLDILRAYVTGLGGHLDVVARIGNIRLDVA